MFPLAGGLSPNTGDFDVDVIVAAFVKIFERCGDGILLTHSQGGGPGWNIAIATDKRSQSYGLQVRGVRQQTRRRLHSD